MDIRVSGTPSHTAVVAQTSVLLSNNRTWSAPGNTPRARCWPFSQGIVNSESPGTGNVTNT